MPATRSSRTRATDHPEQQDPTYGHPQQQDPGYGDPQQQDPGYGDPQQQDPGYGDPQQQDPGYPSDDTGAGYGPYGVAAGRSETT